MNCTTHFSACDCREAKFARLEEAVETAKGALETATAALESVVRHHSHNHACVVPDGCFFMTQERVARAALAKVREILGER